MTSAATAPLLRRLNAETVLNVLRDVEAIRHTELADAAGLSRPTVDAVIEDLRRIGLIAEVEDDTPGRRGRPARLVRFRAERGHVVGIDIGVHKCMVSVADLRGVVLTTQVRSLGQELGRKERLDGVRKAVREALKQARVERSAVLAACAATPGIVDPRTGVVLTCDVLPDWKGLNLRAELGRSFGAPVLSDNDANLAVVGERWRGVASTSEDVIYVLAGERLGAGIVSGGQVFRGHDGGAGEMAFLSLLEHTPGAEGIGALASHIGKEVVARLREHTSSLTGDAALLLAAARDGDTEAQQVLEEILARIARAIGTMALLLNPELIVIGGGVAAAGEQIAEPIRRRLPQMTSLPPRLEVSALGDKAVTVGALRTALDSVESSLLDNLNA
ncbi:ROK family protein [Nonomuraea muscovyensis]|uniref:Putative NBD/HSP70 family sugar kinase n=1 Tax=Nonomuraea muscovyensis TaxID=1124761 RepID=A0A7X0BWS2_9ACTN|nr:ROK family transcriptional regulator [Nonomuraea muscovyensis]MBB6344367.1 putative NBD/HSP70 family sugar kinase [Nonomuraea muscovyensis]MDF2710923.1 putative NagC family transcriptional regulator [Nonomuraea muscovyensis]